MKNTFALSNGHESNLSILVKLRQELMGVSLEGALNGIYRAREERLQEVLREVRLAEESFERSSNGGVHED